MPLNFTLRRNNLIQLISAITSDKQAQSGDFDNVKHCFCSSLHCTDRGGVYDCKKGKGP